MSVVGAVMDYIFDWEADGDRFSFEDSDRFEEDSLCSWISEPESLCNNWRGWRKQNGGGGGGGGGGGSGVAATPGAAGGTGGSLGGPPGLGNAGTGSLLTNDGEVSSLMDLAAQAVARHLPFEVVEHFYQPIPEQLQLRIAFWSFPENEEDIRLYSCLANGSSDEFQRGEMMFKNKSVHDALQIGFHLSATVTPPMSSTQVKGSYNVALVFDRRHITSCTCSCSPHGSTASWCAHVVALCLFRIHQSNLVCLRAPVSESLSRLERDQLQKFAQYLISELPQQILPTAQRLLDELLSSQKTMINTVCGAPDPTAGPSAGEQTTWCLDEITLHENIKKTLVKFCVPSPVVLSDVNYLSNNAPPAANEWQSLLRPLRGREPEGIWNLLLIVREMFRRSDNNAIPLLEILTEEILACEQIVVWWFNNKTQTQNSVHSSRGMNQNNTHSSQHAASSLCDEIVTLWRLAALNPALSSALRSGLCSQLKDWHVSTVEKLRKSRNSNAMGHSLQATASSTLRKSDIDAFTGFKPAIEACQLEWNDYLLIGFTRNSSSSWIGSLSRMRSEGEGNRMAHAKGYGKSPVSCTVNVTDGLNLIRGPIRAMMAAAEVANGGQGRKGLYSSGSEGFSEGERRRPAVMDSGEDHISTETVVGSSEDGGTLKESRGGATLEKLTGKSEDVDSDCGSLPSTPGLQTVSTGPGGFNGSKESPSGSQGMSGGSLGAASGGGGEAGEQPLWEEQKRDTIVATPPEQPPGHAGGAVASVAVPLQDASALAKALSSADKNKSRDQNYFVGVRKPENKQEIMFALAEALHAHGHVREAGRLARELAEEMIASGPDAGIDYSAVKDKKKRVPPYISATLSNASFLCSVLLEDLDCRHLAFRIGLFGLEMARTPATSKSLEVKLAHQESELVIQLKKIPLGAEEMAIIRDRAEKLRDGKLKSRGEALLPITLASFIFDSLCLPANKATVGGTQATRSGACLTPPDEKLGFEAAVAALGLKANVSEAEHPLLCEGTRRQKGELAVAMLVHHKDDPQKLARIMDKLLDKEVHQLYKNAPATSGSASSNASSASDAGLGLLGNAVAHSSSDSQSQNHPDTVAPPGGGGAKDAVMTLTNTEQPSLSRTEAVGATVATKTKTLPPTSKDTDSSAMEEDLEGSGDYKAWEAKFRCANLRTTKKHSVGMASVDSSAPETTSSDNSPTLIRRNAATGHHALIHHGPGSDSGSSHKSSDSVGSSGCDFQAVSKAGDNDGPVNANDGVALPPVNVIYSRSSTPNVKGARYKGKNRVMPCVPNQPSEASAHFMFELAKTVLIKAGGSSSTSLFVNQSAANNTNPTGPHRALHLCAFQIGLYALGLNNFVSPNWLSRTYSSHVSWITGQATEIGYPAINILIKTWEGHLTPQEVASLADRASRCRDPNMVRAAAELALSCLPHAQALNPNEIQRALIQCKEQSKDMLQRACLSVEMAAKEGGVYPEVLFEVAKRWYELYEEALLGPLLPGASSASGGIDRNSGPSSRSQRTSDGPTVASAAAIPIVHVVRDQSGPGMLNPGPLVASATLGQIATYPSGGPLPMPPMSYALPAGQQFQVLHPFLAPQYAYVQSIAPPNFGHYYGIPSPHIPHSQPTMHMAKYPYSNAPQPPYVPSNLAPAFHPGVRPPPPFHPVAFVAATTSAPGSQQQGGGPGGPGVVPSNWGHPPTSYGLLQQVDTAQAPPPQQQQQPTAPPGGQQGGAMAPAPVPMDVALSSPVQINYLLAAYRVGMLAMETLARRVHDDRPQIKYARNPPYGEDVKWLHGIAMKLGTSYLQQFCASSVNTIVSPFILLDIAMESANFLAGNNVTQVPQQLRLPMLSSLLQRCLQMFIQCTHTRIHHITQVDYDEFVSIVCSARNAFCMTPDGLTQFNEMLQGLRRSKSCKRELWQRIISALHNSSSI